MIKMKNTLDITSMRLMLRRILSLVFFYVGSIHVANSTTFYSQASGQLFSNLANWNSVAGGGGSNPLAADLTNGSHSFVVKNAHTITVDQDLSIASLTVGQGASGVLTIGNSAVARNITVSGGVTVSTGGTFNVGAFNAVHTLTVGGTISNGGTFNMVNTAVTRVCNTTMNGASFPQITGANTPTFNDLTINCGASGMDISRTITVTGNFSIIGNTPVTTAFGHTITGSFSVAGGSSFTPSAGTMTFNGASTQAIDVNNATFTGMTFSTGNKSVTGDINCVGNIRINTGVTLSDALPTNAHTITGTFDIYSTGVCAFSGTVSYSGTLRTSYDFNTATLANPTSMGTASWTFTAGVTTGLLAPATNARFDFQGDLTINAGTTSIINNTNFYSSTGSILYLNNASILQLGGVLGANTNFPENFGSYSFAITSTVRYNGAAGQVVKGGATLTSGYGILDVRNSTKTANGDLDINSNLLLNTVTADFSGVNVNLAGTITITGACALTNNQTFTFDADDLAQGLPTGCTYTFNNLTFSQGAPTASRTKTISIDITVNGDLTCSNPSGSPTNLMVINLQNFTILDASPSGTWTLGSNVALYVSGTGAEFQNSLNNFTTISFDATPGTPSIVRFNNTTNATNQDIPYQNTSGVFAYGSIELNGPGGGGNSNNKTALGPLNIDGSIYRVGGTPYFVDGNFDHTVGGDFLLLSTYYPVQGATAKITLDGSVAQNIGNSTYSGNYQFRKLTIANTSATVSINFTAGGGTMTVLDALTINDLANFDASTRAVAIRGDWTQLGTGIYTQTSGTTTFNGTTANQAISIATPSSSYFGNLTISKTVGGAPQTLTASTDFYVYANFTFTNNQATFDATNRTIYIGGNWSFQANTTFTSAGSTIVFNGSATQTITNSATNPTFNNITCTNTGAKNFSNNNVAVNGNFDITGATVSWAGGTTITLLGDWINTGGTGSFTANGSTLLLNGAAQNVGTSNFGILTCSGTGGSTKTLTGNITTSGALNINANITLDVSASNYSISVAGAWTNSGSFTAQSGTVTLTGNTAAITTGTGAGPTAGKNFYNLTLNKTSGQSATFAAGSDLVCTNNLIITVGSISMATSSDVYVGGTFTNNDIFTSNNNACQLTFNNASSATITLDPGTNASNVYRDIIFSATGATYNLGNNLTVGNGRSITINGGTLALNGKTLSMTGGGAVTVITVGAGTLYVDAGSTLKLANQNVITVNNASSVFKVVGSSSLYATVTTNGISTDGYTINQSNGVFHAKYFVFSNLRTTGITLSGSTTIDPTNNISYGSFTAPAAATQYMDVSGISLTAANSITNCQFVGFAAGATNNIKCTVAPIAGTLTFQYASGALQGEANDNDGAAYINWSNSPGVFWTGGGGNTNWYNAANWSSNPAIPTATDYVFIDHSTVPLGTAFQVDIATPGAVCAQLTIDKQGGAGAITLALSGTGDLTVSGNVNIYTGTTLSMAVAANTLNVAGSWSNLGTFTGTNGTVNFNGTTGTQTISTGGVGFPFYNFTVSGVGGTYQLSSAMQVNGDITISDGTFDATTYDITAKGNWAVTGGGIFTPQLRTVTFSKGGNSTQTINGGTFYNLTTNNASGGTNCNVQLLSGITVNGAVTIGSGGAGTTQIQGGSYTHTVYGNWTNNTTNGYSASTSTVVFAGTSGTQLIAGTATTTFNNVTCSGAAQKTFSATTATTAIDGDWQISSGSGQVNIGTNAPLLMNITNAGVSSTFTIAGATTLMVYGSFPSTFESVNLASTSTVQYEKDGAQSLYNTTYGILTLSSLVNGVATTKTAAGNVSAVTLNLGTAAADNNVTLAMANNTFTLTGTTLVQQTGAPQISWGTGTMYQTGAAWSIDADITGFYNLTLSGTGNKTMNANLAVAGDVIVQNGATLIMGTRTLTGAATKNLNLQAGSTLTCALTASVAFPTGFSSYTLDATSTVTLNGAAAQTVQCKEGAIVITYGNLNLAPNPASNMQLNEKLWVAGDFSSNANSTLVDNNFDMDFSGTNINIQTYTPSATPVITLSGGTQYIYDAAGGGTALDLKNITISGTAGTTKTIGFRPGVANNTINVSGTVVINANQTLTNANNFNYSGTSWTNNGTYSQTGGTFTFNGTATQNINPGSANTYNIIVFANTFNPGVVFASYGINVTSTTTLNANARVDMGGAAAPAATLTHTFGGSITNNGYWTTTNAHLVLNGAGYTIPVNDAVTPGTTLTARNVTVGGTGTKNMAGTTTWTVEDLTISGTVTFSPGAPTNTLNVKGNWTNTSTFTHGSNTVNFSGNSTIDGTIQITSGGSNFYAVNFSPSDAVSYTLQSATTAITGDMTLGANATLNLNSTSLTLGRNANAVKTYTINGVLYANEDSYLIFDNRGSAVANASQCVMTVTGASAKLKVVGISSAHVATVSAVTGGTQAAGYWTSITVTAGAEIQARYYTFEYLADAGLVVTSTAAAMHATNNFSDGTFQYMTTAGGAATKYYLDCDAPTSGQNIANVTFGWSGAIPIPANRYNVRRTGAATGAMDFVDVIAGTMGSYTYESDDGSATTGKITWPNVINATWVGSVSSNFMDANNWSTLLQPNINTNCTIPAVTSPPNYTPIIDATSGAAVCRDLVITNGRLDCNGGIAGIDLDVKGSVFVGTTGAGVLSVGNSDCTIQVGAEWTRGSVAGTSFIHGNGTVSFNAATGNYNITPRTTGNYAFYNVDFNGATTSYTISGGLTVNGTMTLNNATIYPAAGITVNLNGDYDNNGGIFTANATYTATVVLGKSGDQNIDNATFYRLTTSGSGNKIFTGTSDVYDNIIIGTGTTVTGPASPSVFTMCSSNAGTMVINGTGVFADGGGSHIFKGSNWTAGASSGTGCSGTVTFNRNAAQTITGGSFYNLSCTGAGSVIIAANVYTANNASITLSAGNALTLNSNVSIIGNNTTGIFTLGAGHTMNVNGASNCPSGFASYALDATSTTNYTQAFDQAVGGITYGNLTLNTVSVKTLTGEIYVQGALTINTSTLDVSSNNYTITVDGAFNNSGTGSLLSNGATHAGEIIMGGGNAQNLSIGSSGAKSIYKLTITKTAGTTATLQTNNLTILNNLTINSGNFSLNGLIGYLGGSLLVTSSSGALISSGTLYLNATSGSPQIQLNTNASSAINILTINAPGITYQASGPLTINGNFTLTAGTFDGNGQYIFIGSTNSRTVNIASGSTYKIGAGGTMDLGNLASVTVDGTIEIIGTAGSIATVSKNSTGGSYGFSVNGGTIKAQYYLFEFMNATGILINGNSIDPTYNLSDGTFTNGPASCKYLTVSGNQSMTINNVSFPSTPTGSPNNVVKSSAGTLTFYNATGSFAGASYEGDDGSALTGHVQWTGPTTYTWTGALSTDWYTAGNWSSSLGGNGVPTAADNAIIATNAWSRHPTIDGSGGTAYCNSLTINATMILTLNTPAGISDLVVAGDISIYGEIKTTSNNDYIEVAGNWTKQAAGTVNLTSGTVTFNGGTAGKTITNGTGVFYHVTINNATAAYLLGSNTTINGNLTITSGSLDVSGMFYNLSVKGDWVNTGTFISQTGSVSTVTLNSTTAGAVTLSPGSSSFNRLTISGGASTVYTLGSDMTAAMNVSVGTSELKLNGHTFNMGDNAGADVLTVTGTLNVDANSTLAMGTGSSVVVNTPGVIKVVGSSSVAVATVTKRSGGSVYAFSVNTGATMHAQYYLFEYMDVNGIKLSSGATINTTNDFRNGTFSNGSAVGGSCFLSLANDFADYTADGVVFNSGPTYNVSRTSGTGNITFNDPTGALASYIYENDDAAALTGRVRWTYTNPQLTWTGFINSDWQLAGNWNTTGPPGPPDNTTDVIIPNVANDPILSANAFAKNLTIGTGAIVQTGAYSLDVAGSFSNTAGTFTAGTGTVTLSATTGSPTLSNASSFYNLVIGGSVTYSSSGSISVSNNFTISAGGAYTISNSAHTLTVGGNWLSTGGTFTHGSGTVTMNKTTGSSTITTGASGGGGCTFNNLTASATGAKTLTLTGNLTVNGTLNITGGSCVFSCGTGNTVNLGGTLTIGTATTFAGGSSTINITGGNWLNSNGLPFSYGTSTVVMGRTGAAQSITRASGETFYNLTINNTYGTAPQVTLAKPVTITGTLTMTSGIVSTTSTNVLTMAAGSSTTVGSATSYIDGPMIYNVAANGASTINFPIGKSTSYRPFTLNVIHSSATSAAYTGELMNSSAANLGYTMPGTLSNVSMVHYWQIDRSAVANLTSATVELYYSSAGLNDFVTDYTNLAVAKTNGAGTAWFDYSGTATANGTGSITSTSFNSFSKFTIANKLGGGNVLPVELISFEAREKNKQVVLSWTTATEHNNHHFEIERSPENQNYESIGVVKSQKENSNEKLNYQFIDEVPLQGLNYYRLKQVDIDGNFKYILPVFIDVKHNLQPQFELYPNPVINRQVAISIRNTLISNEKLTISLVDISGHEYFSTNLIANNIGVLTDIIDLPKNISSGTYLLKVYNAHYFQSKVIIVQ